MFWGGPKGWFLAVLSPKIVPWVLPQIVPWFIDNEPRSLIQWPYRFGFRFSVGSFVFWPLAPATGNRKPASMRVCSLPSPILHRRTTPLRLSARTGGGAPVGSGQSRTAPTTGTGSRLAPVLQRERARSWGLGAGGQELAAVRGEGLGHLRPVVAGKRPHGSYPPKHHDAYPRAHSGEGGLH